MLSLFNCKILHFKKEFLYSVIIITVVTYFITVWNSTFVIVVMPPLLIFFLVFFFKESIIKSIIVVLSGLVVYASMQFGISTLAMHYGYLEMSDLDNSFGIKTYVMQTLSGTIAITIAIYLRIFNGGFGFSLKSKKKPYKIFLSATLVSFVLCSVSFIAFNTSSRNSLFNISGVLFVFAAVLVLYLSYKRDTAEYS
ncbi:hypothetical protein EHS13_24945 [Paenibacillus psychroresistens]|uniref:Uncharacterized protein n=1 Tax=Paenibacillus psychroresistens TaxID=1778678 RepID=A0A6B8RQC9_9BACL|nr:hypothetical protein [Paenibacillus psychroresistens]QGQ97902.1 hypothetical protein EHS13_24945 [Paenibacillus psychroresistens]